MIFIFPSNFSRFKVLQPLGSRPSYNQSQSRLSLNHKEKAHASSFVDLLMTTPRHPAKVSLCGHLSRAWLPGYLADSPLPFVPASAQPPCASAVASPVQNFLRGGFFLHIG